VATNVLASGEVSTFGLDLESFETLERLLDAEVDGKRLIHLRGTTWERLEGVEDMEERLAEALGPDFPPEDLSDFATIYRSGARGP
jgi:hypothetical protein